jgi:Holliday junction DNA helicase RuvA
MLAVHSPDALRVAVSQGDLNALTKVPGIGKKGAERIVLELRDRIGAPLGGGQMAVAAPAEPAWRTQVREALVGLGWSAKQADDAVESVAAGAGDGSDVSGLLRAALRELGR